MQLLSFLFPQRPLLISQYLITLVLIAPVLLFNSSLTLANTDIDVTQMSLEDILLGIDPDEDNPYSDIDFCDDDDIDEDALPDNLIAQRYGSARMAFMFGQYDVAFKAWQPLADNGYAKAQAAMAWMYHTGNGAEKNIITAFTWYMKAAKQGHAIAQNNLAVLYENGEGIRRNYKAAAAWFRDSADSGYSFAQYNIGRMYAEGRGLKKDIEEAKYWWRIASRQGVKSATESLALLESRPVVVKPKPKNTAIAHAPYHANPVTKRLEWIEKQKRGHYTIQLARSKDMDWLLKLAASAQLKQRMVQFKSKDKEGVEWHNLIYGTFSSYQKADIARKALPAEFSKWSPWLRRFGEINQVLLK